MSWREGGKGILESRVMLSRVDIVSGIFRVYIETFHNMEVNIT